MAGSSPRLTQTWVDANGKHVVIDTVDGFRERRNIAPDPRVAVITDAPTIRFRYRQIQDRVVGTTTGNVAEAITALSPNHLKRSFARRRGRDQTRVIVKIEADRTSDPG